MLVFPGNKYLDFVFDCHNWLGLTSVSTAGKVSKGASVSIAAGGKRSWGPKAIHVASITHDIERGGLGYNMITFNRNFIDVNKWNMIHI